jgi:SAM-dependent methyltransferase
LVTFNNPRETWNERYAEADYLFGEAPNEFVRAAARYLAAGQSVLCVADGEGRNSVWLAERGLEVTAFDFASNAVEKARRLARNRNVHVEHCVDDLETWKFAPESFDVLVAIFIQFLAPEERSSAFARMQSAVRPGGLFLLEGYRPEQLHYRTGGPGAIENLYTREWVESTFREWEIVELREYDAVLHEGSRHTGMSALIDLVARRR